MARIPYPDPATLTPGAAETLAKLPPLNVFRMMGHAGDMVTGFARFGNYLLGRTALDPVLREIAIVRVGILSGADYEVQQHKEICRKLGMDEALIAAIDEGAEAAAFDPVQRLVMTFTDDVVNNVRASDASFTPLAAQLSIQEMQELVVCIGFYMMVSRFLETFGVDLEDAPEANALSLPGMKAE
ncbi:MAG TPA: carboxymuconolactone decarboxylase family protein [Chakrabartia sp.]|jgi:alkylhydroperoxidase family enzyme|nr:carboxymuconolactone decarboxylase family protein [Chakrabartia sp.]